MNYWFYAYFNILLCLIVNAFLINHITMSIIYFIVLILQLLHTHLSKTIYMFIICNQILESLITSSKMLIIAYSSVWLKISTRSISLHLELHAGNDSVGYKWFKMVYSRRLTSNPGLKISIQFEAGLKISNKFDSIGINTNFERCGYLNIPTDMNS